MQPPLPPRDMWLEQPGRQVNLRGAKSGKLPLTQLHRELVKAAPPFLQMKQPHLLPGVTRQGLNNFRIVLEVTLVICLSFCFVTVSTRSIKACIVTRKSSKAGDGTVVWGLAASQAGLGSNPDFRADGEDRLRPVINFLRPFPCLK